MAPNAIFWGSDLLTESGDEEALIRRTAVSTIFVPEPARLAKLIAPMLYDPIRTVRIEAASRLSGELAKLLDKEQQAVFQAVLQEYVAATDCRGHGLDAP